MDLPSITTVWTALGGNPPRRGRARAFWRPKADGLNVSINAGKGCWYDHRDNIGGGVLDLLVHVRGGNRADAYKWLAETFGLPCEAHEPTLAERRQHARIRRLARPIGRAAWYWVQGRMAELEDLKGSAVAGDYIDMATLGTVAGELFRLEHLGAEGVVREYLAAAQDDPEETAAVVKTARAWANACRMAVGAVVRKIEKEQREVAPDAGG